MARQLKKQETASRIPGIKTSNGKIVISAQEINQVFMEFYSNLYTSDTVSSPEKSENMVFQDPRVCRQYRYSNWKLREEEVRKAIKSMQ